MRLIFVRGRQRQEVPARWWRQTIRQLANCHQLALVDVIAALRTGGIDDGRDGEYHLVATLPGRRPPYPVWRVSDGVLVYPADE